MDKLVKIISPPEKRKRILGDNPRIIILGSSGSGKSYACCRMLLSDEPFYKHYFRKVFYVNSTLKHSEKNNPYNIIDIPEDQIYEELNDETLNNILDNLPRGKDDKIRPWLLCIDDSGQMERNSKFSKSLFIKIRHYNGSVVLCVQALKMVPPNIRKSATHIMVMNNSNRRLLADVVDEYTKYDTKEGIKMIDDIFNDTDKEERPFVFIDCKTSKVYNRFPDLKDL